MSRADGNFVIAMGRSTMNPIADEGGKPFFGDGYEFEYGKVDIVRKGKEVTLVTTGQVTHHAVKAADELRSQGIEVTVLNVSCPIGADFDSVKEYLSSTVISLEDHNVNSGLGSILSDYLVRSRITPKSFEKIGVDRYMFSGDNELLYDLSGLSSKSIVERVRGIIH